MATRTVTIEIPDVIEITNGTDFALWAGRFEVKVGARGRKPKAELVKAIQAYEGDVWPTTIVDTEYFSADMGEDKARESSEYGVKLAKFREQRDAGLAAVRKEYDENVAKLRAEYGIETGKAASGKAAGYVVTARTPMLDKATGEILRTKSEGDKPGKVKFLPSPRKVELSLARVRELTGTVGQRGRISQSVIPRVAVIEGGWFPVEHMDVVGWETVLLKDVKVEHVDVTEPVTADK